MPGDTVVYEGEILKELFIVREGIVEDKASYVEEDEQALILKKVYYSLNL
jgi:hypothetical protein